MLRLAEGASIRTEIADRLRHHDFMKGWKQAYRLDAASAVKAAEFIIYSALTTVARRRGSDVSWTQNRPYAPSVGNTPASSTSLWTWIRYCGPGAAD